MALDASYSRDFVNKVSQGVPLQDALDAAIASETELRKIFATDRANKLVKDPYIGLVDVFDAPDAIKRIHARDVPDGDDSPLRFAKHVFPLKTKDRVASGEYAIASTLDEFRTSWNVFTEGALSQLTDWSNVVASGGSVLASLLPLPAYARGSKRGIRKYFHGEAYSSSDIDLFLYGLTPEQAEKKAIQIYEAVRDSVPWDTVCVRTKHSIAIHSQYPYRPVQIVLRLYASPAEILAGFDIDCACFLYDGSRVFGNPRGLSAVMCQANLVDMTRRSPSYEVRLAKYAQRGFEVHVPTLCREDIDPTIFERSINRIEGLARLLVLERLSNPDDRTKYLESRRELRGRPETVGYSRRAMRRRKRVKGDVRAQAALFGGLSSSDYGTQSFHIPYGPGFDAKKLTKFIYGTDLGMNSTFNPKNKDRRLHRHPAFFGDMQQVMEDCCEYCPEPLTVEERDLQVEEDKTYIRGRVEFMQEDPGRQMMTGSFHPIDEGEWSAQAYLGPVEKLFQAIAIHDIETVRDILEGGFDLQKRDHVGRTSLHLAILTGSTKIAEYLIDAGARITARLVDGRTSLHLAAQYGLNDVVIKLIEKSKLNEIKAEEDRRATEARKREEEADQDTDVSEDDDEARASSEDDWDSEEDEKPRRKNKQPKPNEATMPVNEQAAEGGAIPEDNEEQPDILDINVPDWDYFYTPVCHAIAAGHIQVVSTLIHAGADIISPFKRGSQYAQYTVYPLTLTLFIDDEHLACAIAEKLIENGATCTAADENLRTVFYQAVLAQSISLVRTFLRVDPNSKSAINFVTSLGNYRGAATPLVRAIALNDRPMVALLLASGAEARITEEMFDRSWEAQGSVESTNRYVYRPQKQPFQWLADSFMPVETAIAAGNDLVFPLIELGADLNLGLKSFQNAYSRNYAITILDGLREAIKDAENTLQHLQTLNTEDRKATSTITSPFGFSNLTSTSPGFTLVPSPTQTSTDENLASWLYGHFDSYLDLKLAQAAKNAPKALPEVTEEDANIVQKAAVQTAKVRLEWLRDIEQVTLAYGGKGVKELHPTITEDMIQSGGQRHFGGFSTPIISSNANFASRVPKPVDLEYKLYRDAYHQHEIVPAHLRGLYGRLFEACWKGDVATIQRLCLPPKDGKREKDTTYLQVAAFVTLANCDSRFIPVKGSSIAVIAKQWNAAKAILAIASAQYEKKQGNPKSFNYSVSDSDDSDVDDDESDMNEPEAMTKPVLIDLAQRLSVVKTSVAPETFFGTEAFYPSVYGEILRHGGPLQHSIYSGDVDTLDKVLELGRLCDPVQTISVGHVPAALAFDNPKMLDALIRRFGIGIAVEDDDNDNDDGHGDEADSGKKVKVSKTYLGLNVNGKKRKDLAQQADPDAPGIVEHMGLPIVWQAAQDNCLGILEWLSTSAPLDAYKHYMATSKDDHARAMRKIRDFDHVFPSLIGATITANGENVVFAHLMGGGNLDTLKKLFALFPTLKASFVARRLRGINSTVLHHVCGANLKPEIFDFFVERGAEVLAVDINRQGSIANIIHHLVARGHLELLKHVFSKLNKDQLATMLSTQTKTSQSTPLLIAVKKADSDIVKLLLSFDHPVTSQTLLTRDKQGNLPIHVAVRKGSPQLVQALFDANPKTIFMENATGSTSLEYAEYLYALWLAQSGPKNQTYVPPLTWTPTSGPPPILAAPAGTNFSPWSKVHYFLSRLNSERVVNQVTPEDVEALSQLIASLEAEGRLESNHQVRQSLDRYLWRTRTAAKAWEELSAVRTKAQSIQRTIQEAQRQQSVVTTYTGDIIATFSGYAQDPLQSNVRTLYVPAKEVRDILLRAASTSGMTPRRELVHLLDAQRAVESALEKATGNNSPYAGYQFGAVSQHPWRYRGRSKNIEDRIGDMALEEKQSFRFTLNLQVTLMHEF
ncbi:SubName: Full=Uncharacterized protein {ECO:0000313/EMBL:CCA66774.1} [Serendipita indica DSM 11827]|nr:SubName: Full=Uncharacterized protein {ECO:0000313/EMBL:CCA66774.1} [Serendipita indica DSM 11827]